MLSIPTFPEVDREIIKSLAVYSDRELVSLHQLHPEQGKFFTALFCRYGAIVHSVVQHAAESQVQADYLFAIAWRQIFEELEKKVAGQDEKVLMLFDYLKQFIQQKEIPRKSIGFLIPGQE